MSRSTRTISYSPIGTDSEAQDVVCGISASLSLPKTCEESEFWHSISGALRDSPRMGKTKAAKAAAAAESRPPRSNVVYLGRIPHGFFEDQMRGYFSQFGELRRLRLSRSKKSARSRGYAFLEFAGAARRCARLAAVNSRDALSLQTRPSRRLSPKRCTATRLAAACSCATQSIRRSCTRTRLLACPRVKRQGGLRQARRGACPGARSRGSSRCGGA